MSVSELEGKQGILVYTFYDKVPSESEIDLKSIQILET